MLQSYIEAGFSPTDFWTITPKLYLIHMLGARARLERDHNNMAWLAWHTAYLPNMKKPISLQELTVGYKPIKKSWEEQLSAWKSFANYKAG
jgi:hypothetical protein